MDVLSFDWDDGNLEKCQSHGVSLDEVESVFYNNPGLYLNVKHKADEERYQAIGRTQHGRFAYVVFTLREGPDSQLIRPISTRYMHKKEIDHYENQAKT